MKELNRKKGSLAESKTADWLESNKGFTILERNYGRATGEIDLIAQDGESIVFVEVKYRNNNEYGYPAEAVTAAKQKKIIDTAMLYLQEKEKSETDIRFDVAELTKRDGRFFIRYTENAFEWRND